MSRCGRGRAASVVGETDPTEIISTERMARIPPVNGEALRLILRNVMIFDETAYIANIQSEYGEPYTVIETDSDAVRWWAFELVEQFRAEARDLSATDFLSDRTATAPGDE